MATVLTVGGDAQPAQSMRLPIRIVATPETRRTRTLTCALTVVIAGGIVGTGFYIDSVALIALGAIIAILGLAFLYQRSALRKGETGLPQEAVEVSAAGIRCRDLVEGDAEWSKLTAFRWVLAGDEEKGRPFRRSSQMHSVPADMTGEFAVEAASPDDASEGNPYGYYDRARIQFELPQFIRGSAARIRADWVVEWLNDLQRRAIAGELATDELVTIPAWLNAQSIPIGAMQAAPVLKLNR